MVRGLMGPIGSGKSVACCMEIVKRGMEQVPNAEGVRRTRWAAIRQTYPELKTTTINTWKEWVPEEVCPIVYGAPIEGFFRQGLSDGTRLELQIYFLALDKPRDVKKLLSLELTGAWINEARESDVSIVQSALSRTGRYPAKRDGALTWSGIIMDTNPPDDDHWWYNKAEKERPQDWEFFRQPGALIPIYKNGVIVDHEANPLCENKAHQPLGYHYWKRLTRGSDPEWVSVHCCGEYGSVYTGRPVYKGVYNDVLHVSSVPLGVFRGMPLILGFDFGLTPACTIGQFSPSGQLRVLRELECKRGGILQFVQNSVKPMLATVFPGMPVSAGVDPAGRQGSQVDEKTCIGQLREMGIPAEATWSNRFLYRRQAVIDRLSRMTDGKPALLLDPSCVSLRRGFQGGFKFERVQVSGEERYKDEPAKNKYSHIHDALQYMVMRADAMVSDERNVVPAPMANTWQGVI